ncbi:hypothetical protein E2I21_27605, partial [Alcaligenaceae bacterium SAGV5]|nr:hypothetical protein [Alcaligenaceae bacterium SAGV5]
EMSGQQAEYGLQMSNGAKLFLQEHGDVVAGRKRRRGAFFFGGMDGCRLEGSGLGRAIIPQCLERYIHVNILKSNEVLSGLVNRYNLSVDASTRKVDDRVS